MAAAGRNGTGRVAGGAGPADTNSRSPSSPTPPSRASAKQDSSAAGLDSLLLYKYFLWRKNAFSDLQVILLLNLVAVMGVTIIKVALGESLPAAWTQYYAAAVTAFGESWPPLTAQFTEQAFALVLYVGGLIVFAVVLSLVEQSVLQVYEKRVEQGSPVLETDHVLVLTWCRNEKDLGKLQVVLTQLCAAFESSGGRTIVVLSLCKKTALEGHFGERLPAAKRGGSRFVFRQGNPLRMGDLQTVAADEASAVVVLSDSSLSPDVTDSQVLRVAVLLDELEVSARNEGRRRPVPGHVVAEIRSEDAVPLLKFMLVKPVLPLTANRQNASRLALLVTRPVLSSLADSLWDFSSGTAISVMSFPELAGKRMADIGLSFSNGLVLGLLEVSTGLVLINPPLEYRYSAGEHLILLRPTGMEQKDIVPLSEPAPAPLGSFSPEAAATAARRALLSPTRVSCSCEPPPPPPEGQGDGAAAAQGGAAIARGPVGPGGDVLSGPTVASLAAATMAANSSMDERTLSSLPSFRSRSSRSSSRNSSSQSSSRSSSSNGGSATSSTDQADELLLPQQPQQPAAGPAPGGQATNGTTGTAGSSAGDGGGSNSISSGSGSASDPPSLVQALVEQLGEAQPQRVLQQLQKLKQLGQLAALNQAQEVGELVSDAEQSVDQQRQRQQQQQQNQDGVVRADSSQGVGTKGAPSASAAAAAVASAAATLLAGGGVVAPDDASLALRGPMWQSRPQAAQVPAHKRSELLQSAARRSSPGAGAAAGCGVMFQFEGLEMQLDRSTPVELLVLGWSDQEFMVQLLAALQSALPSGSTVTFASQHSAAGTLLPALAAAAAAAAAPWGAGGSSDGSGASVLAVRHVLCDPLRRSQLAGLDLAKTQAAIIMCDRCWATDGSPAQMPPPSAAPAPPSAATAAAAAAEATGLQQPPHGSSITCFSGALFSYLGSAAVGCAAGTGGAPPPAPVPPPSVQMNPGMAGGAARGGVFGAAGADGSMGTCNLSLDAVLLRVQLNLRSVLEGLGRSRQVNIITEQVGNEPDTRFEDEARLPFGVTINRPYFTACLLSQLVVSPLMIMPRMLASQVDPTIVDADVYAAAGEEVTFWQLMRRAQTLGHLLLGYYQLPTSASGPIQVVLCPPGPERATPRVWNAVDGDNRLKFVVLQDALDN